MPTPKPEPTALKLLRGNPGKRRINHDEPQHPPLALDCPPELTDPLARSEWDRVAPVLIPCGVVTVADRATLLGYCLKYAQWQALEREAAGHPFLVRSPNGYPMPNPALGMANRAFHLMLKAATELGITPSARSRIVVDRTVTAQASRWADKLA